MRGSSPLNWALIRGDNSFSLSVIRVAAGIDSGDILIDRTFDIDPADTIADLHDTANREFPSMLVEVIRRIQRGEQTCRVQDSAQAGYYPLRLPDDGFILWDQLTARQTYNQIRALTDPYPGAFTFHRHRRIVLLAANWPSIPHYGEPGRVYRVTQRGLLVCAMDQSIWITRARYSDGEGDPLVDIMRYDRLATVREAVMNWHQSGTAR
jgi:methionyl-tRNA formyltransferase